MSKPFFRKFRLTNRINELVQAIEKVADPENVNEKLEEAALESSRIFFPLLKRLAPVGQEEPSFRHPVSGNFVSHGRPSIRLHGMTLEQGWQQPEIIKTPKGMHMRFHNTAPHIRLVMAGAPGHNIPGRSLQYPLTFWWGTPLRWPPKDGQGPGPRAFFEVNHPGFKGNNFARRAWQRVEGKASTQERFRKGVQEMFGPLDDFFGG